MAEQESGRPEAGSTAAEVAAADLTLVLAVSKPGDEIELAIGALGLPVRRLSGKEGLHAAVIAGKGQGDPQSSDEVEAAESAEGYSVAHGAAGELRLVARTRHGLANGLYDVRRALLVKGGQLGSPAELLSEGDHSPHFAQRAFYHFLTTWGLERLSCDTLTAEQWKTHLGRMRALNANQFYFDIWADQYYHPDYPQTLANKVTYDRLRGACDYAHKLGLRTGVYFFPCQVPPSVYLANPDARAVEAVNYHGINMCPSRAWNQIVQFDTFLLSYMGKDVDNVVVEMQDPGSCLCELCCRNFADLVIRFIETYRQVPGGPSDRRIDLCTLHFRDWLEDPGEYKSGVAFPITDLRRRVFEMLPEGTTLVDIDEPTLIMGRDEFRLKSNYFFFDLDPESGMENNQVFPRAKLSRIRAQIEDSVNLGHQGITAYRMMPYAQYVADYALLRKCWSPQLGLEAIMEELAAEWGIPSGDRSAFVGAVCDLDAWWEKADIDALQSACATIERISQEGCAAYLGDFRDTLRVLLVLGRFLWDNRKLVDQADFYPAEDLVDEVYSLMTASRMFEAYTVYQHWVSRSREIIGQRIRWWLQGISRELRTCGRGSIF